MHRDAGTRTLCIGGLWYRNRLDCEGKEGEMRGGLVEGLIYR